MTEPDVLTPKQARGCSAGLALAIVAAAIVAFLFCGCRTYTVVAADREVVPVRQSVSEEGVAERRTYVEADDDATGWFVPDSIMLELLEAD